MTEKWHEGPIHKSTGEPIADGHSVEGAFGVRVSLTLDSGTANSITTISHNLGRTPQGIRIINVAMVAAADAVWYRLRTDDDWNERNIDVRFRFDDCDMLLEVI